MGNYNSLKAIINANIKENGNREITGVVMNSVLNAMVNTLGAGYMYAGVATPSTDPGTPDAKVFYFAATAGTYTNFGSLSLSDGEVAILKYGTMWTKDSTGFASSSKLTKLVSEAVGLSINDQSPGITMPFPFEGGKTYVFLSKQANGVNISTRETASGSTIDGPVYLAGNGSAELTASSNAKYLQISAAFTGIMYVKDSTGYKVYIQDSVNNSINQRLNVAETDSRTALSNSILDNGIALSMPNASTFINIPLVAGTTYVIYSRQETAVNISTWLGQNVSMIDGPVYLAGNGKIEITATQNANYIKASNTFSGFICTKSGSYELVKSEIDKEARRADAKIDFKVDVKLGKNLFDKDSPLLQDNSCFNSAGNVTSTQYTIYWLISNPIYVKDHRGGKIICNKSYTTTNRYICFVDDNGNKTAVLTSVDAYTIPNDATIAYICVYKNRGVVNLDEVQIEFGDHTTSYEPYSPIAGYAISSDDALSGELIFPTAQEDKHSSYLQIDSASIYAAFDEAVSKFPSYITKTALGKDASDTYDMAGYTIAFTQTPTYKILFVCNQHGGSANGDQPMGAYIATRLLADLCGAGHRNNALLRWIRENVQVSIIPVANPWGVDHHTRTNANGVDLNRNWDTSGWSSSTATDKGSAPADQPEVQHCVSFINSVSPDIIVDNHTLGGTDGTHDANSGTMIVGFPKDNEQDASTGYKSYFSRANKLMQGEFGITLNYSYFAGNTDTTPDLRVWAYENGYYGGLIEMQWRDPLDSDSGFTASIIDASYFLAATLYQYYFGVFKD